MESLESESVKLNAKGMQKLAAWALFHARPQISAEEIYFRAEEGMAKGQRLIKLQPEEMDAQGRRLNGVELTLLDDWFDEVMIAEASLEEEQTKAVLDQVRIKVSPEVFADIEACIAEIGIVFDFKLVDRPVGKEQDDGFAFGPYFVNQTCNGGYSGDSYEGAVSVPLNASEWLQFAYSM